MLRGPFPCGNGELTSNLHILRWYIIIKESRGENVQLRMTVFRQCMCYCYVWPWVHLGLSVQGIPASQVCPEQKAKMTQRSVLQCHKTNNKLYISCKRCSLWVCCPSRGRGTKQTSNWCQNKNNPLGNLMIHKTKSRLQHQRLVITHKSHWVICVCFQ